MVKAVARERRSIERRFRRIVTEQTLVSPGTRVIVGISGGPDSSALLLLLGSCAASCQFQLEAAYFDHQIRDRAERLRERETVETLTRLAGVSLHYGEGNVPATARQQGRSLEEQARLQRYRFLHAVAETRRATIVAVGHTRDDQAESVLLHLLRGAGLAGLASMKLRQPWVFGSGPCLIRPLLPFSRDQTVLYCRLRGIGPHIDSLNDDIRSSRSRIRHELLPLLRTYNPAVDEALGRLSRAAAEQQDFLEQLAAKAMQSAVIDKDGSISVALSVLRNLAPPIQIEVLFRLYAHFVGNRQGLTERHLTAMSRLIQMDGGRALDLPRKIRARSTGERLFLEPIALANTLPAERLPVTALLVPGRVQVGRWEISAELVDLELDETPTDPYVRYLDAERIAGQLTVRSRLPGDRLTLRGASGSKKVQDILVDAKVPRSLRDSIPIICSGKTVVWVVGHRSDANLQAGPASVRRIRLTARNSD
ncbi:MAG: tRNA lysidine(34) synthetase TilS [Dehalococcoidia bacterium]